MTLEFVEGDAPGRVRLVGELDLGSAPAAATSLELKCQQVDLLEVDLSELTFIDSSGVRVLLRAFKDLADRGGTLVLEYPTPTVQRVFDLLGLAANGVAIRTAAGSSEAAR